MLTARKLSGKPIQQPDEPRVHSVVIGGAEPQLLRIRVTDKIAIQAGNENPAPPPRQPLDPAATILSLGNRRYAIKGAAPVIVTEREDAVLQAFLDHGPIELPELKRLSGYGAKAPDILRQLAKKYDGTFANAIRMPGRRGQGGYYVRVGEHRG
jgi:hypothetical protein